MTYLWKPHRYGEVQGREVLCPPDYDPNYFGNATKPIRSIATLQPCLTKPGRWLVMLKGHVRIFDDKDEAKDWAAAVAIIEGGG